MIPEHIIRNAIAIQFDKHGYDYAIKLDWRYDDILRNGTDQDMKEFYDAIKE